MTAGPGGLVVLESTSRRLMTKRIRRDARTGRLIKSQYGNEKFFRVRRASLGGFPDLAGCLTRLTGAHCAFVVRGEPFPDTDCRKTRRLLYDDPETGERASFCEVPRHWFAVDMDKAPAPPSVDGADDPDGAIEYLIGLLPPELHDASCWWRLTASQGLPVSENALSAGCGSGAARL